VASVSLGIESAAGPAAAALPALWRQRHVYVLAGMVGSQIALSRGLLRLIDVAATEWSEGCLFGALITQCFLLGLWGALGGLSTLARWGLLGAIHVAGVAAISTRMPAFDSDPWTQSLEWGIIGAVLVLAFATLLLPLRRLAGWRVDFDRRFYRGLKGRRGQVSFIDYAGYTASVAAALAVVRLSVQAEVLGTDVLATVMGIILMVALLAGPLSYLVVAARRLGLALLVAFAWTVAIAAGHSWLSNGFESLDFFGPSSGPQFAGVRLHLAGFYSGVALLAGTTLVTLRLCGLQLIAVPLPQEECR